MSIWSTQCNKAPQPNAVTTKRSYGLMLYASAKQ